MEKAKENKFYLFRNRTIIRSVLAIFTVAMIVFGSLAACVLAMVGPEEINSKAKAEDTKRYQESVDIEVQMLQGSLDSRRALETNGEIDMNKTIDIMQPHEADKEKQNSNTTFTLEAITQMNREGVFNEIEIMRSALADEAMGYYVGQSDYEEAFAQGWGYKQQEAIIVDRMKILPLQTPISGKPLMEYVQNNKDSVSVFGVCTAFEGMRRMLEEYDEFAEQSSPAGTNLRYFVKDNANNQIVTNGGWKSIEEAEKVAKEWGTIIRYKRNHDGCEISKESSAGFEMTKQRLKRQVLISGDEEVLITIDKSYPVTSRMSQFSYVYNNLKPYFEVFIVGAIISLLVVIASFISATFTTGQSKKKGEVHLNIFDKIPTEIAATLVVATGGTGLAIVLGFHDNISWTYSSIVVDVIYWIVMLVIGVLMATWGYLSLVRRIKAKDLWKNSMCRRVCGIVKKIYGSGKMSARLIVAFVLFALAHIFFIYAMQSLGVIIMIIADTAILLYLLKEARERQVVKDGLDTIAKGNLNYKIDETNLQQDNKEMACAANKIGDGLQKAVAKSMKNERMRSELITNVSHDIKTPLTSIINYVDLLKRENIQDQKIKGYIDILDNKSQRLKHLTEDLVEASKVNSGNIELHMNKLNLQELLTQAEGEFTEKLEARQLQLVSTGAKEPVIVEADGRQMWRIFENLLNNIAKYSLEGTRVYIDLVTNDEKAVLNFKNVSQESLNINADELTERFVRGDISRTTEGSGLGLSIAKSLTEVQGGKFDIYLDGDLFKVTLTFELTGE